MRRKPQAEAEPEFDADEIDPEVHDQVLNEMLEQARKEMGDAMYGDVLAFAWDELVGKLHIDEEFRRRLPDLALGEQKKLEQACLRDGVLDPIVVWQGENIVLDGHHRLEIARRKHLQFRVVEIELPDRQAAWRWILDHQLARRNLNAEQTKHLIGLRYNAQKKSHGGPRKASHQNDDLKSTAEAVAEETGVGPATVERLGRLAAERQALADELGVPVQKVLDQHLKLDEVLQVRRMIEDCPLEPDEDLLAGIAAGRAEYRREARAPRPEATPAKPTEPTEPEKPERGPEVPNVWFPTSLMVSAAREVMGGIDLNPAWVERPKHPDHATKHLTPGNGLRLDAEWRGRIWLCPPPHMMSPLAKRLVAEFQSGHVEQAVAVGLAQTWSPWLQELAKACSAVCLADGWTRFQSLDRQQYKPPPGFMIFYLGPSADEFVRHFARYGAVLRGVQREEPARKPAGRGRK